LEAILKNYHMPLHLLIDTCSLVQLVSLEEFSPRLKELEYIVKNGDVTLFIPDKLKEEWPRRIPELQDKIRKKVSLDQLDAKRMGRAGNPSAAYRMKLLENIKSETLAQIEIINQLLNKYAIPISLTPEVRLLIEEQKKNKKKPFDNSNKDHWSDAEISFTTFDYCSKQAIKEVFFVSHNHSQFAGSKKSPFVISPDIAGCFPDTSIHYYNLINDTLNKFYELGIPRYNPDKSQTRGKVTSRINVDTELSVLDQIHDYLIERFKDWHFIPKDFFARHKPFILAENYTYYDRPFTLVTDNREVYDLLTKIEIKNGSVVDNESLLKSEEDRNRIKLIFAKLWQCNIWKVAFKDQDEVQIKFSPEATSCDCSLCLYKRMEWSTIIKEKSNEEQKEVDKLFWRLRAAYGQYKVKNYYRAATIMLELLKETPANHYVFLYIINFNLRHLAFFLRHHYYKDDRFNELAGQLEKIDLTKLFETISKDPESYKDLEILEWLHSIKFMSDSQLSMYQDEEKITDAYHSQSGGRNEDQLRLTERYAIVKAFLNENSIMFDSFLGFENINRIFVKGLFGSYGSNPKLGGKLHSFEDYYLQDILFYGDAEVIERFMNRYKELNVDYNNPDAPILKLIDAMLDDNRSVIQAHVKNSNGVSDHFWDNYTDIFFNALAILGSVKIPAKAFNQTMLKIADFLEFDQKIVMFRTLKHLRFLFDRKINDFSDEVLERFFLLALRRKDLHGDRFFEVLIEILNRRVIKIDVSENAFGSFISHFLLKKNQPPSDNDWFVIGYVYQIIKAQHQKMKIESFARNTLNDHFDGGNYYLIAMFDILSPDEEFHSRYVQQIESWIDERKDRLTGLGRGYIEPFINHYINYSVRFSKPISSGLTNKIMRMNAYFKWLLDLDGFDYSQFDTDWLHDHFTLYFKLRFRSSIKLKDHLLKLIKKDPFTELERRYMQIYDFED
jgi:hypothetical protein